VFTLRGLRQSGKTTLAKRLIAERVAAGHARRTCFLSLQTIETADELREAIELVLRLWPDAPGDWLFVLDELTFVHDWARPIVYLREHDRAFRGATVLLTGSSAYDLAASADLLHGRRGRWHRPLDRLHMPMSFRDYATARNPAAVPEPPEEELPPQCFCTSTPTMNAPAATTPTASTAVRNGIRRRRRIASAWSSSASSSSPPSSPENAKSVSAVVMVQNSYS